jgi:HEAT repeat protein
MDAIAQKDFVRGTPAYSNLYVRLSPRLTRHLPTPVDPTLVQIRAYWALEALGPLAKPAARLLAERVVDEKDKLRSFSTHALGAIGTNAPEVVPILSDGLKNTNREVWSAAGEMMLRVDPENQAALDKLAAGLKSSDAVSRRFAANALGQESPLGSGAERRLLMVLDDEDLWVRFRAAMALFKCYPTNQQYLTQLIEIDRSPQATFGMLMDVAQIRPATAETTKLMFESYKLHGRRSSGNSYYEDYFRKFSAQDSNAVPALIEALGDTQNPKVRALAAQALGQIGPPAAPATAALSEAAQSDNDDARREAVKALERIASRAANSGN